MGSAAGWEGAPWQLGGRRPGPWRLRGRGLGLAGEGWTVAVGCQQRVKDAKGLAISVWNRYFGQFNNFIRERELQKDLNQTIEVAALLIKEQTLITSGRVIQKEYRSFLRSIGQRKKDGGFVAGDLLFNEAWWQAYQETNGFHLGEKVEVNGADN